MSFHYISSSCIVLTVFPVPMLFCVSGSCVVLTVFPVLYFRFLCCISGSCFVGPFASAMVNRFRCRVVCISGAVISCVGFILVTFSMSIEMLMVTYGCIGGKNVFLYGLLWNDKLKWRHLLRRDIMMTIFTKAYVSETEVSHSEI